MQVSKWGNSLAVRLPKALVKQLGLAAGDELTVVKAERSEIAVARIDRREDALARMAERNWSAPADYRFDREDANRR